MIKEIILAALLTATAGDKTSEQTPQCPQIKYVQAYDSIDRLYTYRNNNKLLVIDTSQIFAIENYLEIHTSYRNKSFTYDIRKSESDLFDLHITKDDPEIKVKKYQYFNIHSQNSKVQIVIVDDMNKGDKLLEDLYIRMRYYKNK